jgi:hypothetical protein
MFSRCLERAYLPSCIQLTIEKKEGTGVHDVCLLSPHEQLPSEPNHNLLHTTDTIKRVWSDRKVRCFETTAYCYVFICMLANGFLNRQHAESLSTVMDRFSYWHFAGSLSRNKCFFQVWMSHVLHFLPICDLSTVVVVQLYLYWCC